jgi:tetratricopeptide (TPR) repeat protein
MGPMWLVCRGALLASLILSLSAGVSAQDDLGTQQARALFEAGRAAFEAAEYEDALRHFRESYERSGRAALLYNIGVSADRLRRDQEALDAFERYLADAPAEAPQRADAEARVRVLRGQLTDRVEGATTEQADTAATTGTDASRTSTQDDPVEVLAGWGVFGGGLAVAATGAIFLGLGQADASSVEGQPTGTTWTPELEEAAARGEWMRVTGWVLAGIGLAAAAAGITLVVITPSPTESAALELRPGGLAFIWRGQ